MANIASLLSAQLATPDRILYRQFMDGVWRDFSVREVAAYAARWQAFFRAERLERGERVALCLKNGIHWVTADQAALGSGLVIVPLYADDNPENVAWCLQNSGARVLVAENSRMAAALAKSHESLGAKLPRVLCLAADKGASDVTVEAALPKQAGEFEALQCPLVEDRCSSARSVTKLTMRPRMPIGQAGSDTFG